jgi:hypothetical protein
MAGATKLLMPRQARVECRSNVEKPATRAACLALELLAWRAAVIEVQQIGGLMKSNEQKDRNS